jgi:hypothetical protein
MGGDLCVFFPRSHPDKTTRGWIANEIFQRLISCRLEADSEQEEPLKIVARS